MYKEKIVTGIIIFTCLFSLVAGVYLIFEEKIEESFQPIKGFSMLSRKPGVAVVYIYGVLAVSNKSSIWGHLLGGTDRIVERLKRVEETPSAKAVVLRINSPGGTVGSVQEICRQVERIKNKGKKVVVSMGDVCASGGYYIASKADKIVTNPGTITGSIGVLLSIGNLEELFKKIGVKIEVIKSGKYKDIGSSSREMTSEEKKIFKGLIDDAYNQFLDTVIKGRGLDRNHAKKISQGQIFTGNQAIKLGLVDEIGDFQYAIRLAAKLAGIKGKPRIIEPVKPLEKFIDIFSEKLEESKFFSWIGRKEGTRLEYILQ